MSTADRLFARLDGVRETGPGRWLALCPAHADRSPSLSIRELGDGRILIHCFAECDVVDILSAVGLELTALFPEPLPGSRHEGLPPQRRPFSAADALKALTQELTTAVFIISDAAKGGKPVTDADADRLAVIAGRVGAALEVAS